MRLTFLIDFLLHDNDNPTNDPADRIGVRKTLEESDISKSTRHFPHALADSIIDEVVALPDANTDYVLILTDQEISIKVNNSVTSQTLKPLVAGTKTFAYYMRGDLTGLKVSNSSGSTANVDIILVKV